MIELPTKEELLKMTWKDIKAFMFDCSYCYACSDCSDCSYCSNCSDCFDCSACSYMILNVQLTKKEYEAKMKEKN